MNFEVNIHTGLNGVVFIEDYSNEYDQYLPETGDIQYQLGYYKYSECKTLNILTKINTDSVQIVNSTIHNHDQLHEDPLNPKESLYDIEKISVKVKTDGFYHLHHIVLPTKTWYEKVYLEIDDPEYKSNFDVLYLIDDDSSVLKVVEGKSPEKCCIKELVERNIVNTNIEKCIIDIFYTGFLQRCYIDYCKELFDDLTKTCNYNCVPKDINNLTYIRDFLWMVLNIIDYHVSFKQYLEAQRILELVNNCNGFCKNDKSNAQFGCRCS